LVSFKVILITVGIAALGIVILAGGMSLQSAVQNEVSNVPQWLQGVIQFGKDAGSIAGQGFTYLGIAVIAGSGVFLIIFRNN